MSPPEMERGPRKGLSSNTSTLTTKVKSQDTSGDCQIATIIPIRNRYQPGHRRDWLLSSLAEAKGIIEAAMASGDPEEISDASFIAHRAINLVVGDLCRNGMPS